MLKLLGAVAATAMATTLTLTAGTAFAETAVQSSQKSMQAEWAKSQARGGYGFPLTAIPVAIDEAIDSAFTGKDGRGQTVQGRKSKTKTN